MSIKFPWISRERYEEMRSVLDSRIAKLEDREKLLLNTLAELGWGMPLFPSGERVPQSGTVNTPAEEGAKEEGDPNQEFPDSLLELAMRETGSRNPRVLCRHIDRMLARQQNDVPQRAMARIEQAEEDGAQQGLARAKAQAQEA